MRAAWPWAALFAAVVLLQGCGTTSKEHKACKKIAEQQCMFYGYARFDPIYRPANYEEMCNVDKGIPKLIELCLSKCGNLANKHATLAQAGGRNNKEFQEQFDKAAEHKKQLDALSPEDKAKVDAGEMTVPMVTEGADKPHGEMEPDTDPGGPIDTLGYCVTHAAQASGMWMMNEVHCAMVADWACPGKIDAPGCAQLRVDCVRQPCRGTRDEFKACIDELSRPGNGARPKPIKNTQAASRLHGGLPGLPGAPNPPVTAPVANASTVATPVTASTGAGKLHEAGRTVGAPQTTTVALEVGAQGVGAAMLETAAEVEKDDADAKEDEGRAELLALGRSAGGTADGPPVYHDTEARHIVAT